MVEDLIRAALLNDLSIFHENNTVAHFTGKSHLMGNADHGHTGFGQILHDLQDFTDHFGVQGGGGFVKEHDVGIHAQGPDNGDTLFLAAGKLYGIGGCPVFQTDAGQKFHGPFFRCCLVFFLDNDGSNGQVLQNGLVREQIEVLEDHAHFLAEFVQVDLALGNDLAFYVDGTVRRLLQQVQTAQESGFTGAGRSDHDHDISLVDINIYTVQSADGTAVVMFL